MLKPLYKAIIVSGLILVTSLPGILCLVYQAHQEYIRHEMEERLELSNLQLIQLPSASLEWNREGKELIVEGKLFDVKSMKVENGVALIFGLFDEEETDLKEKIEQLSKQQESEDEKSFYSKLLQLIYFKEDNFHLDLTTGTVKLTHSSNRVFNIIQQTKDLNSPPPEI